MKQAEQVIFPTLLGCRSPSPPSKDQDALDKDSYLLHLKREVILPGLEQPQRQTSNISFESLSTASELDSTPETSAKTRRWSDISELDSTPETSATTTRWSDMEDSPVSTETRPVEPNFKLFERSHSKAALSSQPSSSQHIGKHGYPLAIIVRNTFLELESEDTAFAMRSVLRRRARSQAPPVRCKRNDLGTQATGISNVGVGCVTSCPVIFKPSSPPTPPSLRLREGAAVAEELGFPDRPSLGSSNHALGGCRPCAFFWKSAGCTNGKLCEFCHLCDPLEKKRRHKAKKALLKAQALAVEQAQAQLLEEDAAEGEEQELSTLAQD